MTAPGPLGASVAFLSFPLVSSPVRGEPSPQSAVQSRAGGSGCLQGNRDRRSVASTTPSESCKRISHVTGKNARGEPCLLMRRNHSARRFCGTGGSLAASHRAPSSPRCWGRQGPAVHGAPQTAGSQAQQWRATGRYSVEVVGAGCRDNTVQVPQGQPGSRLLVGGASSSGWRVVGASPDPPPSPWLAEERSFTLGWGCQKQKRVMARCAPLVCDMQSLPVYHIYSIQTMLHYFLLCYIKNDGWIH